MTYEEALRIMRNVIYKKGTIIDWTNEKAFEKAIEALEKQIPKKIQLDNDNGVYEKEYCPLCNKRLFSGEKYCSRCGQALDWSGKE